MENNKKYYIVKGQRLAGALEWLTGQHAYKYISNNENYNEPYVYSFVNDEDFRKALATILKLKSELEAKNK